MSGITMKKLFLILSVASVSDIFADDVITKAWNPKPLVEGNRRVDELIEWNKEHPGEMPPLTEEEKYEYFIKDGIPLPNSGTQVKPLAEIKMSPEQSAVVKKYISRQKQFGFQKEFSLEAKNLMSMPDIGIKDLKSHRQLTLMPEDTHLRANSHDLKMSYEYMPLDTSFVKKVIGFSPEHTYIVNGWTGAIEFFQPHLFNESVCAFHEINIKITGTSAIFPKEVVSYKVNDKITKITVNGNDSSGYIYKIEWWDKTFKHNLDCASKSYSVEMKDEILALAKAIDSSRQ